MSFELTNPQRACFGLDPVDPRWEKVPLEGSSRPGVALYFDGETIKRRIVSRPDRYEEDQFDEATRKRSLLLPKTGRGKTQKLTPAVLEKRQPIGVYLKVRSSGQVVIANYTTQTTFYSTSWDRPEGLGTSSIPETVERFIRESPSGHGAEIERFRTAERRNVKFRSGDYFALKLDRTRYGFGRILLDIGALRKSGRIGDDHGLNMAMGHPVLVQLYARAESSRDLTPAELQSTPTLPSSLMMDNALLYGEYEIIGHQDLKEEDFDFPLSYGRTLSALKPGIVFLQWGLIHRELPKKRFGKYLTMDEVLSPTEFPSAHGDNPFGFYSIGFRPSYGGREALDAAEHGGVFSFDRLPVYSKRLDLRNPRNEAFRKEILEAFGLDPRKSYLENCKITGTPQTVDVIRSLGGRRPERK